MCVPPNGGSKGTFVSKNLKSWSFSVPFFTLLLLGIAMDGRPLPQPIASSSMQPVPDSPTVVQIHPSESRTSFRLETQSESKPELKVAAPVVVRSKPQPKSQPKSQLKSRKTTLYFANLIDVESHLRTQPDSFVRESVPSTGAKQEISAAITAKSASLTARAIPSNLSQVSPRCICPPTSSVRSFSRGQYASVAPKPSLKEVFAKSLVPDPSKLDADIFESNAPIALSDEEIRRRTTYAKAKNRALARINKAKEQRQRRTRSGSPQRRRKTLNLAQYKAILASKIGINRLVENHKSPSSTAPFSMRHVGQYLGLGGGNVEGTGYSARSPYEALAVTSYANLGLPVLYRGVARGRDGYYAYQIYRK